MGRLSLLIVAAVVLASCGGKQDGSETAGTGETAKQDPLEHFNREREKYERYRKAAPEDYAKHHLFAEILLQRARAVGDPAAIEYCEKELKAVDKRFRDKGLELREEAVRDALHAATMMSDPTELWGSRWEIWDRCANQLNTWQLRYRSKADLIQDLVREAENRRERCFLLQKAYMRFTMSSGQAEVAMASNDDPQQAVAHLAIFRAWMRSVGLIPEEVEESAPEEGAAEPENVDEAEASARKLLSEVTNQIGEYEKQFPPLETSEDGTGAGTSAADLARIPWEDISPEDFLIFFNWNGTAGTCEASDELVTADAGSGVGVLESADSDWNEFLLELEVRMAAGARFFLGARPVVSSGTDQPEYKRKVPVALSDRQWHLLRIQVRDERLVVFELSGENGTEATTLGEPVDLLPVTAGGVTGGFMIGLGSGTKLELRHVRLKVISRIGDAADAPDFGGGAEEPEPEPGGEEIGPGEDSGLDGAGDGEEGTGDDADDEGLLGGDDF